MIDFLPDVFRNETDLDIELTYEGFETGYKEDLIAGLDEFQVLVDGSLRGWTPDMTFTCGSQLVITMVELLLGALPETIEEPEPRNLSKIELDVGEMVIGRIASVLKSAVTTGGGFEPLLSKPYNGEERIKPAVDAPEVHSALIRMGITIGKVTSSFSIILPQRTLLKTVVTSPKSKSSGKTKKEWTEQLKEQVQRSHVTVEARIKLQSLSLGTISRLQAGDVIPFFDLKDVKVGVNANGRELYVGEFGRSGSEIHRSGSGHIWN